ncbi:metallo-dependent hydrolase, subgroup D [Campylobacter sp. RM5004]|uniref:aminofutalosine deaminase family hydrolase n=1 Tax=Campylobacter sp. RM5004 TaxID=1660078 RepID=UPI001EFC1661|nr:amidohydrolase family protein [Campylobacter sp. RM5004]ULO01875.1 metallo-dependent hydrolase, subgroup D [Campylobacter sp. RM5004]
MIKIMKTKAILDFSRDDFLQINKTLVFDEKIIKICDFDEAIKEYKNAHIIDKSEFIISPVLCNLHSHLEFCLSRLYYGDFAKWLESIIANRQNYDKDKLNQEIKNQINIMLKSGVGYLGEISSFGANLESLSESPIKSIIFHEILGANDEAISKNIDFFEERFSRFSNLNNHISLHSPYSICDKTYDYAINFAKKNDLLISTHYLESPYELEHLKGYKNNLSSYLARFNPSLITKDFLSGFDDLKAIFTHCNYVDDFSIFKSHHIITSCPRSNRFLGSRALRFKNLLENKLNFSLGTDGLSSNNTLNMFDELRAFLYIQSDFELNELAFLLYKAVCFDNSHLFLDGLKPFSKGASADFIILDDFGYLNDNLLAQIILRTQEIKNMYLDGKEII